MANQIKNFTDLTGRVAVCTGTGSALGGAIAKALKEAGAEVVSVDDPGDRGQVDSLRDETLAKYGHIDVLVNAYETAAATGWDAAMEKNLTSLLRCCQSFYEPLAATGKGRVINLVALQAFLGLPGNSAYAAAKAGVLSLTRSLAVEWAKSGINVNAIVPGPMYTDDEKLARQAAMRTPLKRFGTPEELSGAAVLLASDAASFITGHCLAVDGGYLASGVNQ